MIRLKVSLDGKPQEEVGVDSELSIGRAEDAGLRLDQPMVSKNHAVVAIAKGRAVLRDLKSRNGTRLNDRKIDANVDHELHPGDRIRIDAFEITVEAVGAVKDTKTREAQEFSPDMTLRPPPAKSSQLAERARFQHARPRLVIAAKDHRETVVLPGIDVVIGRDPAADVVIGHADVSRRHARIALIDDAFFISDLGSQWGTQVDGTPVGASPRPLRSDQALSFGSVPCLFVTEPPDDDPTAARERAGKIARHLVRRSLLTAHQLESVLEEQVKTGASLGELLVTRGLLLPADWSRVREHEALILEIAPVDGWKRTAVAGLVVLVVVGLLAYGGYRLLIS